MKTITKHLENTLVIEKSRFICELFPVANEKQAKEYLQQVRDKHPKASHHCYAYIIKDQYQNIENQSDDGEPSKTAGLPMLEILRYEELVNVLAVVTRYFGGTLLGTGGLVRAYSSSVKKAVDLATLKEVKLLQGYSVEVDYGLYQKVAYELEKRDIYVTKTEFKEGVSITFYTEFPDFITYLKKISNNLIKISELDKIYH